MYHLDCNDDELEDVNVATERTIMSRIYKEAFYPNGVTDIENDRYVSFFSKFERWVCFFLHSMIGTFLCLLYATHRYVSFFTAENDTFMAHILFLDYIFTRFF